MKTPLFLIASLLAGMNFALGDPVLSIAPQVQNVSVDQTFLVDVDVSNVTDLYDYELSLSFNPQILSANGILEGSLFANTGNSFFLPGSIDNTAGTFTATSDTLFGPGPGLTGAGVLATVQLTALANGLGTFAFAPLSDLILQDSAGNRLAVTTQSANVTVGLSAVPEPATLALTVIGTILACFAARRFIKAPPAGSM